VFTQMRLRVSPRWTEPQRNRIRLDVEPVGPSILAERMRRATDCFLGRHQSRQANARLNPKTGREYQRRYVTHTSRHMSDLKRAAKQVHAKTTDDDECSGGPPPPFAIFIPLAIHCPSGLTPPARFFAPWGRVVLVSKFTPRGTPGALGSIL